MKTSLDNRSMSRTLLVFLGICLTLAVGERVRYDNYRVYKIIANTDEQLAVLNQLDGASDSVLFLDGVHGMAKPIHAIVAPHKVPDFVNTLDRNGVTYELVDENAQQRLDEPEIGPSPRAGYGWTRYYRLEDNYDWLKSLNETYPDVVTLINAGTTYEGRQILGVKISYKAGNKAIFIEGGIHAREWIAPATVTYLINELLTSSSQSVRDIAENNDWYLIPHANPDGYAYTWSTDRLWRKTRAPHGSCFGADPNRNWDADWNSIGSSTYECSEIYAGPSVFSEIEVKTLSDYIASLQGQVQLYISFHSYSQYLLYPYGYKGEEPTNSVDLKAVFDVAIAAVSKQFGTIYTGGTIYEAIYPASGSSIDWVYDNTSIKLAYCFELRPSSRAIWYGFQLPAAQIIPTGIEIVDSLVAMVKKAKELSYL